MSDEKRASNRKKSIIICKSQWGHKDVYLYPPSLRKAAEYLRAEGCRFRNACLTHLEDKYVTMSYKNITYDIQINCQEDVVVREKN